MEAEAHFLFVSYRKESSMGPRRPDRRDTVKCVPIVNRLSCKKPLEHPDQVIGVEIDHQGQYKRLQVDFDPFLKIGSVDSVGYLLVVYTESEDPASVKEDYEFANIFETMEAAEGRVKEIEMTGG